MKYQILWERKGKRIVRASDRADAELVRTEMVRRLQPHKTNPKVNVVECSGTIYVTVTPAKHVRRLDAWQVESVVSDMADAEKDDDRRDEWNECQAACRFETLIRHGTDFQLVTPAGSDCRAAWYDPRTGKRERSSVGDVIVAVGVENVKTRQIVRRRSDRRTVDDPDVICVLPNGSYLRPFTTAERDAMRASVGSSYRADVKDESAVRTNEPQTIPEPLLLARTPLPLMNRHELAAYLYASSRLYGHGSNVVSIGKQELADAIGIRVDCDHVSSGVWNAVGRLAEHSLVRPDPSRGIPAGRIVTQVERKAASHTVELTFDVEYLSTFTADGYVMLPTRILSMRHRNGILLYRDLCVRRFVGERGHVYTVDDLRRVFGMPESGRGSYVRSDGTFDRAGFDKYVIAPLQDDFADAGLTEHDGMYWRKQNVSGIAGYEFTWADRAERLFSTGTQTSCLVRE